MKTSDITPGIEIGNWMIVSGPHREVRRTPKSVNYIDVFECLCRCGTGRRVRAAKLVRNSRSCGCLKLAAFVAKATVHGFNRRGNRSRLYSIWSGMIQRCTNQNNNSYHMYGGIGISVCPQWRDFAKFAIWANAQGYSDILEIDRIDGTQGYSPSNCRWVTEATQQRNKLTVWKLTAFGETKCLTDWALDPRCTVTPSTIRVRLSKPGCTPEHAITNPRRVRLRAPKFIGNHITQSHRN